MTAQIFYPQTDTYIMHVSQVKPHQRNDNFAQIIMSLYSFIILKKHVFNNQKPVHKYQMVYFILEYCPVQVYLRVYSFMPIA